MLAPAWVLSACGDEGEGEGGPSDGPSCECTSVDGGRRDASGGSPDADLDADAASDGEAPDPELFAVQAEREMRGMWVASVSNIDFPLGSPDAAQARAQIVAIVERAAQAGLNALFFQVRPESDALYRSNIEPWSRFLTGTQGRDPGYDPLAIMLEEAHARGIEVHAWVNPYRAVASSGNRNAVTDTHITKQIPGAAILYGSSVVMDPSNAEVRQWVLRVIDDLLGQYAVDGLHYDDYFYPYPSGGAAFPDNAQYTAYVNGGGTLSKLEWRVANVNLLVEGTHQLIAERYPSVRFGISPFGIHRPDPALGITGLDAYAELACDAPHWLAEGWVDYVAPQLYWTSTADGQAFGTLAGYWAQQIRGESEIYLGHALHNYGTSTLWSFHEYVTQVAIGRGLRNGGFPGVRGNLFFTANDLTDALVGPFAERLFPTAAIPPTLPRAERLGLVAPPQVLSSQEERVVLAEDAEPMAFRAVYTRTEDGELRFLRLTAGESTSVPLPAGDYALANVRRGGVLSAAVPVQVTPVVVDAGTDEASDAGGEAGAP